VSSARVALCPDFVQAVGQRQARRFEADILRWATIWSAPSIVDDVSIRVNRRLRTSIARYRRKENCVEVGPRFLESPEVRREALAHELAHRVAARLGAVQIHGKEWQSLMAAVGFQPRPRIAGKKRHIPASARTARRFLHQCPICHMMRTARRPVTAWRCATCVAAGLPGKLVITRY
jgi:predicted SprT family Zn-dependent metalloprotease